MITEATHHNSSAAGASAGQLAWLRQLLRIATVGVAVAVAWAYWRWFSSLDPLDRHVALWVTIVGAMTNVACALLGCYLVLRRMSLLGDALSHAVLPGLVVAFVLSGRVHIGIMFFGALVAGLVTTFLVQTLSRRARVAADASMGVVFTAMFALGLILLKRYTGGGVDLDPDCVFLGALDYVGVAGQPGYRLTGSFWPHFLTELVFPRPFVTIAPMLVLNVLFIVVLWKELKVSSFDPALATSMGFSAALLHYVLMAMVALTTVASFEAVGSVLVVAMLIVPAATAHLLTDRLARMLWIAAGIALAASVLAYWASYTFNVNTPGMMALIVGGFYLSAVFLSPRYGVVSKLVRNARMSLRIIREDLLALLYRCEELAKQKLMSPGEAVEAVGGTWRAELGLRLLLRRGLVRQTADGLQLTADGRRRAGQLVRSHRLWEAYLFERLGLPPDHLHDPAERMEHYIDQQLRERLADDLQETATDPHGRTIPTQEEDEGK